MNSEKHWDTISFTHIISIHIINKNEAFPLPLTDIKGRFTWKFTQYREVSVKYLQLGPIIARLNLIKSQVLRKNFQVKPPNLIKIFT